MENRNQYFTERMFGWFYYYSSEQNKYDTEKCGKWMCFFTDQEFANDICKKAMNEKICCECKCTDMETTKKPTGVICFYLNGDDLENHKKVISFMLDNSLVRKTKTGKLYNMSFKFDRQTRAKEYGESFKGEIKLENFLNLETGDWII